jgi:glucokinase
MIKMINMISGTDPTAIGVGCIGPIDKKNGCISNTPNLPFKKIPIIPPLKKTFGVPVNMMNDGAAAVLGEKMFGAGRESNNIVYVTLSTGIGGGAIVDGNLLIGKNGNAVEIGHFTINPKSDIICGCGCPGHWEAYSSGNNIPKFAKKILKEKEDEEIFGDEIKEFNLENITAKEIFASAKQGNKIAAHIVQKIGEVNTVGFANLVAAYDPEVVTIGGSIALKNPDLILNPISNNIKDYLLTEKPEIIITPLKEDVVLYGALGLAIKIAKQN